MEKENLLSLLRDASTGWWRDDSTKSKAESVGKFIESLDFDISLGSTIVTYQNGYTKEPDKIGLTKSMLLFETPDGWFYHFFEDADGNRYDSIQSVAEKIENFMVIEKDRSYRYSNINRFKYFDEYGIIVNYTISLRINEPGSKMPTGYYLGDQWFIITDQKNIYSLYKRTSYYNDEEVIYDVSSYDNYSYYRSVTDDVGKKQLLDAMTKIYGQPIMNIGANNFVILDNYESINKFFKYNAKLEVKNGPVQKKIEELTAIELADMDFDVPKNFAGAIYSKTVIQKVKENTAVVRWHMKSASGDASMDGLRIYIEGKDIYACKLNNAGKWIRTTISNIKAENFLSAEMEPVNKDDLKGTLLQYYSEIIDDIPAKYRSIILLQFVREPKIEQLFKMGFSKIIYKALDNNAYDIMKYARHIFNAGVSKEKNLLKSFGVNKYQVNKLNDHIDDNDFAVNIIRYIKLIFNDIIDMDNKTFDALFKSFLNLSKTANRLWGRTEWCDPDSLECYEVQEIKQSYKFLVDHGDENLLKVFKGLIPQYATSSNRHLYSDYIRMVSLLDDFKNFKLTFKNDKEIKEMHDAATAIYNLKRNEMKTKAFVKELKKIEKLQYENKDDDFCVISPKLPNDLANEGLQLHHCVKSYIERVASGATNIMFIRKKDDIDKPFFTVEVSNDKVIEQVHGFGNRNANTEPGLTEFVERWARNKHLKVHNINKVR